MRELQFPICRGSVPSNLLLEYLIKKHVEIVHYSLHNVDMQTSQDMLISHAGSSLKQTDGFC